MSDLTWYLGPLGMLMPIVCPEPGIDFTTTRYGGVHQGLSGARTMDVTGQRAEYKFQWTSLDPDEREWLEMCHTRHIPGPHYLINPMVRNRLSREAASSKPTRSNNQGVTWVGSATGVPVFDWPASAGVGAVSLKLGNFAGADVVRWDDTKLIPVFPTETITFSVWMKASTASTVKFIMDRFSDPLTQLASVNTNWSVTTAWQRFTYTDTVVAGTTLVRPAIQPPNAPSTSFYVAAPQLEAGSSATDWSQGGGAPQVLVDQFSETSRRYPFADCELNLLES
jgi:hypothetical protein